jgi:hypothetical protein
MISFLPRDKYAVRMIGGKFPEKVLNMNVKCARTKHSSTG